MTTPTTDSDRQVSAVETSPVNVGHHTNTADVPTTPAPDAQAIALTNSRPKSKRPAKSQIPCKFFATQGGCRAGQQCQFAHVVSGQSAAATDPNVTSQDVTPPVPENGKPKPTRNLRRQYQAKPVDQSKIVAKPEPVNRISKRDHEVQQIKRRFNVAETSTIDSTILSFKLQPTDPDFPFELEALECILQLPKTYPDDEPRLSVKNKEIEKGFRINVENGFTSIIQSSRTGTLLSWLNMLDRQLESLLAGKKAETIKFVANHRQKDASAEPLLPTSSESKQIEVPVSHVLPTFHQPTYSPEQRNAAAAKRGQDTRQLEARLGRQTMYAKSSDGIAYTLPIEPRRKFDLPTTLQNVRSLRLFVPMLYPLLPCRIALQGVPRDSAQAVEQAFEQKVKDNPDLTLVGYINHLVTHMHLMAVAPREEIVDFEADEIGIDELALSADESDHPFSITDVVDDRTHLHFIPRPPEWQITNPAQKVDLSDDSSDTEDASESEEESKIESTTSPERGVAIDFPGLQLYGIELLDLITLGLTVRCLRCKEVTEIENVHHTDTHAQSSRLLDCRKCSSQFGIAFHHQLLHPNSSRAGYLDLVNCTVADMLLSKFAPTCDNCSTTFNEPGVTAVRGDTTLAICRKCHTKMSFQMPEVKFLLVSSSTKALPLRKVKKARENLGIRAGEPLPRHGRCKHYAKSKRWFRFSCCAKVYPCDRCHDEKEAHPNEHANRMICGYCSREQRYRPEDCGICKAMLVGKKYTGFWEGGEGTRDKARMSRKDPRKYKRRGGRAVGGS